MQKPKILVFYSLISLATLGVGGFLTSLGLGEWYESLNFPDWQPPAYVFGPAWTTIFTLLTIATYRIHLSKEASKKTALVLYSIQILLNICWSLLFFALHSPSLALIEIFILDFILLLQLYFYFKLDRLAGLLLLPYFFWLLFATILNWTIVQLN